MTARFTTLLQKTIHHVFFNPRLAWLRFGQLIAAVLIFAYFALKPPGAPGARLFSDEQLHFTGNVLLALSCWYALYGRWNLFTLLIAAFGYSMAIEMAQALTPARTPDMADALVNAAGLLTGASGCFLLQHLLGKAKRFEQQE